MSTKSTKRKNGASDNGGGADNGNGNGNDAEVEQQPADKKVKSSAANDDAAADGDADDDATEESSDKASNSKKGKKQPKSKSKKKASSKKGVKSKKGTDEESDSKEESKKKVWKWGILATGKIAEDFVQSMKVVDNAKIVAVGGRDLAKAQKFAKDFDIDKSYGSLQELVEDKDVEIVYVASTHQAHHDNALLALRAGKHVLCEKAFTSNAVEAAAVIKEANERKLMVMEAMWTRHLPAFVEIRKMIDAGDLGDIRRVSASFGFHATEESAPRLFLPEACGGALLDVGIYPISLASWIFGGVAPTQITAKCELSAKKVDVNDVVNLEYGPLKHAQLSFAVDRKQPNSAVIEGTKGFIYIDGKNTDRDYNPMWHCAQSFTFVSRDDSAKAKPKVTKAAIRSVKNTNFNFKNSGGLSYQAEHMMQCLDKGLTDSPLISNAETLIIMRTNDEIRKQVGVCYPWEVSAGVSKA